MFGLHNLTARSVTAPRHPGGGSQFFTPTNQPQPPATQNAFDSGQSNFLFFFWGNGTLSNNTPSPFGHLAGSQVLYYNYAQPVLGVGGIVTGQLIHAPLTDQEENQTGFY
jgi:hypothetical protein